MKDKSPMEYLMDFFLSMLKVVTDGYTLAWCTSEDGEVLAVTDDMVVVQGVDVCTFRVARAGEVRDYTMSFDKYAVRTILL